MRALDMPRQLRAPGTAIEVVRSQFNSLDEGPNQSRARTMAQAAKNKIE